MRTTLLACASLVVLAPCGLAAKNGGENHPAEQWQIFAKRADQLLRPLGGSQDQDAVDDWRQTLGYRTGLYHSLAGFARYLSELGYDGRLFRLLTDGMMAETLPLSPKEAEGFITAFFEVAAKVPSHNERLQNLVIWFNHPVFAPHQDAIALRIYDLYRQRGRLDLFSGSPKAMLSRARLTQTPRSSFADTSQVIRERVVADLMAKLKYFRERRALCEALQGSTSAEACLNLALIAALKYPSARWVHRFQQMRQPGGHSSPALTAKLIHWLTYRERYRDALQEFARSTQSRMALNTKQLKLFLLVKTGAYEQFDREAQQLEQQLDQDAATWRQRFASATNFDQLGRKDVLKEGLELFSFEPLAPWYDRLRSYQQTRKDFYHYGRDLIGLGSWQRLTRPQHHGLRADSDMIVVSSLLDDLSEQLVKGSLAELATYKVSPSDKVALLNACKLILEQDSRFGRYAAAADLMEAQPQDAALRWQSTWQGYLTSASGLALSAKSIAKKGAGNGFLSTSLLRRVQITDGLLADQRDFDRRRVLWHHVLNRQQSVAHHATRIQLILEKYRDQARPGLDASFAAQDNYWHRIGSILSTTYKRSKTIVDRGQAKFDASQRQLLATSESLDAWQRDLHKQRGELWQAFAAAQPNLLQSFDTMIARHRGLLEKWRTDRLSGHYMSAVGHDQPAAQDKLEALSSSLQSLKIATWLDWQDLQ